MMPVKYDICNPIAVVDGVDIGKVYVLNPDGHKLPQCVTFSLQPL
jgi:hypothetical protein